jgi:hypothetical protein
MKRALEEQAVWVVSWVIGTRFDPRRKKSVDVVHEVHVIGTRNAYHVAQIVIAQLYNSGRYDWDHANEAVQMKRAGYVS